jgi:hypothetical protein
VKTIRSLPMTVPPENDTVADSRGRWGSGSAYDGGQALAEGDAAGLRDALGLGDAGADVAGGTVAVAVSDAVTVSAGVPIDVAVDALHAAASATATTHQVRMLATVASGRA